MQVGDVVVMVYEKRENVRGRKAEIIDIDYLSSIGSYPDRYTVKMCKSGVEFDCTRDMFVPWTPANKAPSGKPANAIRWADL